MPKEVQEYKITLRQLVENACALRRPGSETAKYYRGYCQRHAHELPLDEECTLSYGKSDKRFTGKQYFTIALTDVDGTVVNLPDDDKLRSFLETAIEKQIKDLLPLASQIGDTHKPESYLFNRPMQSEQSEEELGSAFAKCMERLKVPKQTVIKEEIDPKRKKEGQDRSYKKLLIGEIEEILVTQLPANQPNAIADLVMRERQKAVDAARGTKSVDTSGLGG